MKGAAEQIRVSLVIPGRNVSETIAACLRAVSQLLGRDGLEEIVFVDDGSTDQTSELVQGYPVHWVRSEGRGAAAARNVGWQAARMPFIWFIDADCVAEPQALRLLLAHLKDPQVAAVGGSYANLRPEHLLACLVHEEIIQRHLRMPKDVNVLASYHVIYRREVLEKVGGFDPSCRWAHDAELSYRVGKVGRLRFVPDSRVGHFHPIRWLAYLNKQYQQGFWRVMLYRRHPRRMLGDSYSGGMDFAQPPLAMLILAALPLLAWPTLRWIPLGMMLVLLLVQLPMTLAILYRTRRWRYASYALFGFLRAFWRGLGMSMAVLSGWRASASPHQHTPAGHVP